MGTFNTGWDERALDGLHLFFLPPRFNLVYVQTNVHLPVLICDHDNPQLLSSTIIFIVFPVAKDGIDDISRVATLAPLDCQRGWLEKEGALPQWLIFYRCWRVDNNGLRLIGEGCSRWELLHQGRDIFVLVLIQDRKLACRERAFLQCLVSLGFNKELEGMNVGGRDGSIFFVSDMLQQ